MQALIHTFAPMLRFIVKIIISALSVMICALIIPGVDVQNFTNALLVAAVLALLNAILKPILIVLTIPITMVTLGLFLLAINAFIILVADRLVDGFIVDGFWWALLFSIILSLVTGIFEGINKGYEKKHR